MVLYSGSKSAQYRLIIRCLPADLCLLISSEYYLIFHLRTAFIVITCDHHRLEFSHWR